MKVSGTKDKEARHQALLAVICDERNPWTWGSQNQCCLNFNRYRWYWRRASPLLCIPSSFLARLQLNRFGLILFRQIFCGEGMRIVLAVEFDWEFVDPVEVERLADEGTAESGTLWEFKIEMTLTSRIHPIYRNGDQWGQKSQAGQLEVLEPSRAGGGDDDDDDDMSAPCRWAPLARAAFRPKQYSLRVEKGRFIEPFHNFQKKPFPLFQPDPYGFAPARYAYRLLFDTSPYPARDEWQPEYVMEPSAVKACLNYCRFWEHREFVRRPIPKSEQTWAETLNLGWWLSPSKGAAHKQICTK